MNGESGPDVPNNLLIEGNGPAFCGILRFENVAVDAPPNSHPLPSFLGFNGRVARTSASFSIMSYVK